MSSSSTPPAEQPRSSRVARWTEAISRRLRPTVTLAGRRWPAYGTFVCTGISLGLVLTSLLGWYLGLSGPRMAYAAAIGVAAALLLAHISRAATGGERYVFFHYQFASLTAAGIALAAWPGPVLAHLDLLALTLGIADASGRIGCVNTGCCHGRPARWGIRYSPAHVGAGFPPALVGVRLWPVQPLETLAVGVVVLAGAALLLTGAPPGTALTVYLLGYAACRFLLERLRGDADRPHRGGLSEGQWTSLATLLATLVAAELGWLPLGRLGAALGWAVLAALGLAAFVACRRHRASRGLVDNRHATELAGLLHRLSDAGSGAGDAVAVASTERGLRLSIGPLPAGHHVSLSRVDGELTRRQARAVAAMVLDLGAGAMTAELVPGGGGVWHLLIPHRAEGAPG